MDGILIELCPIWFIPACVLWVFLNLLCERFDLAERLSKRYGWTKRKVEKWQNRITTGISLVVALVIIVIISKAIDYNLFDSILAG